MKIIVCGPPHSGKSVLIANLQRLMPTDSFQRITANGDGEGVWSNNPDQQDVKSVRVKTENSPSEFKQWTSLIKKSTQDIVLIDIGGRLQDDKSTLFDASNAFVIVCSQDKLKEDSEIINKWKNFGEQHECQCLAIIETALQGEEQCYEETPLFRGLMTNLERGHYLENSAVLQGLADTLLTQSNYSPTINFNDIARRLGCVQTWHTKAGVRIDQAAFTPSVARRLQKLLLIDYVDIGSVKFIGTNSNWVTCIAAKCLCGKKPERIKVYDYWTNTYIPLVKLDKHEHPNEVNHGLSVKIEEQAESVTLKFDIPKLGIDTKHFSQYKMPYINESKPLYISGRFPNWFMATLVLSFQSPEKYLHIPGSGYICVEATDDEKLGTIVSR